MVWDSVTDIHKKVLDQVVAAGAAKAEAKGKPREPFAIELQDYGVMSEQIGLLLRRFRDLPCHFGVTALERRDTDDDGKVVYRPAVTPALSGALQGWMDMVIVTSVADMSGEDEYRGLSRPVGKYRGKDRFGVLPRYLIDPTFDRVWSYIFEEMKVDDDPVMQAARKLRADLNKKEVAEGTD